MGEILYFFLYSFEYLFLCFQAVMTNDQESVIYRLVAVGSRILHVCKLPERQCLNGIKSFSSNGDGSSVSGDVDVNIFMVRF